MAVASEIPLSRPSAFPLQCISYFQGTFSSMVSTSTVSIESRLLSVPLTNRRPSFKRRGHNAWRIEYLGSGWLCRQWMSRNRRRKIITANYKIRLPFEYLNLRLPDHDRVSSLRSYHLPKMLWFSFAVRIFYSKAPGPAPTVGAVLIPVSKARFSLQLPHSSRVWSATLLTRSNCCTRL